MNYYVDMMSGPLITSQILSDTASSRGTSEIYVKKGSKSHERNAIDDMGLLKYLCPLALLAFNPTRNISISEKVTFGPLSPYDLYLL
jgi:hypothetical protein